MAVLLNHTIVSAVDAETSARWFTDLFGLPAPQEAGPFWAVETANGVGLDFVSVGDRDFDRIHYAFLVDEHEFTAIFGRIVAADLEHWADPGRHRPGEINRHDGGRGVYFPSNDGHHLEILTRPYGSGT